MKKILVLLLCVTSTVSLAQRLKYKELFPLLADMTPTEQLSALHEYVGYELDHPNANFRLALLHERSYKMADPLTQFATVMAHAQESSNRFLKAKQLVTEQQVRSDNEYYAPLFGQLDAKGKLYAPYTVVQTKLQKGYDSAILIQQKLPAIFQAFTRSVNEYDKAVKLFANIKNRFKSEEDIWMFYTPEFERELNQLANHYDSSLHFLQQYQARIADYPIKKYNQKLSVQQIKTYRLDGLINRMTFLENTIVFWDYRKWVEHIQENYTKEVVPMLQQLINNETTLNERLQKIPFEDLAPVKIDKELIYDLNNYDKNSLALSLLRYKAFRQEWALKQKATSVDTTTSQKLELFSTLIQQNRIADSLQREVIGTLHEENTRKHKKYLDQFYDGATGLNQYMASERTQIDRSLRDYQETLKQNLIQNSAPESFTGKFIKFGTASIPLFTSDTIPKALDNVTWVTQMRLTSADGSIYLLGVAKPDKKANNQIAFIARVNPDGKPGWLQPYNMSIDSAVTDANSVVRTAVLTQEGCALVVTSTHMSRGDVVNTFVYITEKKEEKLKKTLKDNTYVRALLYIEESNTFVLAMKGATQVQNFEEQELISVVSINALGDLVWRRDISMAGTFTSLLPVRDGFILAGNFTLLRDHTGKEWRTRLAAGQANPYLLKLSSRGDVLRVHPFTSDKSIYLTKIVKVNDGSINLLASEATFTDTPQPGNVLHVMVNYQLKVICSTL
jgi:hypothetical protein